MIKIREKWDFFRVELTFELYESAMVFRVFIFSLLLRTIGKKEHLDENDFRHCYVFFFRKCRFESYFITEMFTGLSQN